MKLKYYVIYPGGDRSKLKVTNIFEEDLSDYALASRHFFDEETYALNYARELAKKHNKQFVGDPDYLD